MLKKRGEIIVVSPRFILIISYDDTLFEKQLCEVEESILPYHEVVTLISSFWFKTIFQ
jgi:hypothetical protein